MGSLAGRQQLLPCSVCPGSGRRRFLLLLDEPELVFFLIFSLQVTFSQERGWQLQPAFLP